MTGWATPDVALLDAFVAVAAARALPDVLERAVDVARQWTDAGDSAAVGVDERGAVAVFVDRGLSRALLDAPTADADVRAVVAAARAILRPGFLGVPVVVDGQVRAALYLTKPTGGAPVGSADEQFVTVVADQAAVALAAAGRRDAVARASHDLRTPLTSIRAATSMLQTYWASAADERKLRLVTVIDEQAQRLTVLLDELLPSGSAPTR